MTGIKKGLPYEAKPLFYKYKVGGSCAIRTRDNRIKSAMLYRLS
jgi:hypothetical protein